MSDFDPNHPVTFAQGRNGEVIITQGYGNSQKVWRPTGTIDSDGIDDGNIGSLPDTGREGPTTAPDIDLVDKDSFYVARVDINNGGSGYTIPPIINIDAPTPPPADETWPTGCCTKQVTNDDDTTSDCSTFDCCQEQATAIARINRGRISEVEVDNHGRLYLETPNVSIADGGTDGSTVPALLEIVLEQPGAGYDPVNGTSGIVLWEKVLRGTGRPCTGDPNAVGQDWLAFQDKKYDGVLTKPNPGDGVPNGSGAWIKVAYAGAQNNPGAGQGDDGCGQEDPQNPNGSPLDNYGAPNIDVVDAAGGSGYYPEDYVEATIKTGTVGCGTVKCTTTSCGTRCPVVFRGYPLGPRTGSVLDLALSGQGHRIKAINIVPTDKDGVKWNDQTSEEPKYVGGRGYPANTKVRIYPYQGAPESTSVTVATTIDENGAITNVQIPTNKYVFEPAYAIGTNATSGNLLAIMRATFRGTYQCYYRWVDNSVPEASGGPLYTNLSPVTTIDAGNAATALEWEFTLKAGLGVELWRTSSNQATTLFRVASFDESNTATEFTDCLNDHELTDPKREEFLAMPILLPNGELNANRFGIAPDYMSVGVMFQDRLWMGVFSPGEEEKDENDNVIKEGYKGAAKPNYLYFSELDEPESMPDVNEIIIQQNLRASDYITALIPYAGALIVCQSHHCHRLTYVSQPLIDIGVYLFAYRGCVNQRCWDIYEGMLYVMDEQGVYALDPQGKVESLTVGLDDIFQHKVDWNKSKWFIVRADRKNNVLRCSVMLKGENGDRPTRQYVYSLDFKSWWEERHPQALISATDCRTSSGGTDLVYGTESGSVLQLGEGLTDIPVGSIASVAVKDGGRGYKRPPKITVNSSTGNGAIFTCGLDVDGRIVAIQVLHPGTGYVAGDAIVIEEPDNGDQAVAELALNEDETQPVHYSMQTGNMEFVTDQISNKGGVGENRSVSVVYQPTNDSSIVNLSTYYNGASYPRSNVVARDRGVGFKFSDKSPSSTLDMIATSEQKLESHGVARAVFSGRTLADMDGSDKHISIGLSGKQDGSGQVAIHSVDIHGVVPQEK